MGKTWHDKAHQEIHRICHAAWLQANTKPDGTRYKRHRPYRVPEVAERLIACLDKEDEAGAKAIFTHELID